MFHAFGAQLNDALTKQNARTSAALKAEKVARYEAAARRVQAPTASANVKREHDQVGEAVTDGQPSATKRQKIEADAANLAGGGPGEGLGPDIDVTTLGFDVMLELLFVTLNAMDESAIRNAIEVSLCSRSTLLESRPTISVWIHSKVAISCEAPMRRTIWPWRDLSVHPLRPFHPISRRKWHR